MPNNCAAHLHALSVCSSASTYACRMEDRPATHFFGLLCSRKGWDPDDCLTLERAQEVRKAVPNHVRLDSNICTAYHCRHRHRCRSRFEVQPWYRNTGCLSWSFAGISARIHSQITPSLSPFGARWAIANQGCEMISGRNLWQ